MKNESAFPKMRGTEPSSFQYREFGPVGGLTKREVFAAMAMNAVASGKHSFAGTHNRLGEFNEFDVVKMAVKYADALIAELERTNQGESG